MRSCLSLFVAVAVLSTAGIAAAASADFTADAKGSKVKEAQKAKSVNTEAAVKELEARMGLPTEKERPAAKQEFIALAEGSDSDGAWSRGAIYDGAIFTSFAEVRTTDDVETWRKCSYDEVAARPAKDAANEAPTTVADKGWDQFTVEPLLPWGPAENPAR